ncbi:MAG: DeoR/GlpR family DNA-binding transcription regulator [Firmicutes bacterium]|nr:DeoR/GlpR family DNA-binding transcription regulator [Bacillota bacterium]
MNKLPSTRRQKILDLAVQQDMVRVDELVKRFNVSAETIRRDLDGMASEGLLLRTHGGAMLQFESEAQRSYAQRELLRSDIKQRMAAVAIKQLPVSGSVLIDAGSTTTAIAERMPGNEHLNVVTNALTVVNALARNQARVQLLGGEIRWESFAAIGVRTILQLQELRFDVAFIGCNSMDANGFYTSTETEALTKAAMGKQARRVILVADGAKFRTPDFAQIGIWDAVHCLITDGPVPEDVSVVLNNKSVDVILA